MISRRHFVQLAAYAFGVPAGADFFSAWRAASVPQHPSAPTAPPEPPLLRDYQPKFFDAEDFAALQAFTEILIPTDETPGAREAHCAHFIDFVLQASTDVAPDTLTQWRSAMRALKDAGFHAADGDARAALVAEMARPEHDRDAAHPAYFAYRLIKQQNTFAFYTSRAGIIENLDYRGNSYYPEYPACSHPEHQVL